MISFHADKLFIKLAAIQFWMIYPTLVKMSVFGIFSFYPSKEMRLLFLKNKNLKLFAFIFSINDENDFFKEDGLKGCEMPIVHQTIRLHAKAPPPTLRPCASDGYMLFHVSLVFLLSYLEDIGGDKMNTYSSIPKYHFFFSFFLLLF